MSESTFRVKIIIDTKDQTSRPAKKAAKGVDILKTAAKLAAGAFIALQVAQKAVKFVKFGARVQRAEGALNALAKEAGTSGDAIVKSIQVASDFTIDRMAAMEAANKAMLLNVASSPEEFALLTEQAVKLGRAMGQDAAKSIDDFVVAAGRQSRQIADNLGLMVSAEDANLRFAESNNITVGAMDDAQRKAAFLQEMLRQAQEKTDAFGDAQLTSADKIEQSTSALKDAGASIASFVASLADASGAIDATVTWSQAVSAVADSIDDGTFSLDALVKAQGAYITSGFKTTAGVEKFQEALADAADASDDISGELDTTIALFDAYAKVADIAEAATKDLDLGTVDFIDDLTEAESGLAMYEGALGDVTEALLAQEAAVVDTARANREAAADFTSFGRDVSESAADFAKDREEIEAEHQENLADIAKKGRSTAIRFDVAAETERLSRLKERLVVSLKQQAEFNDKTKDSTRASKEFAIANLEEEIAAKEQRLADFHAGRLVRAGINTDALVAEEAARFAEELALLDENRVEQERIQRESLGRMLLSHVVTWGEMAGATATEIEAMQLKIAEEYGIITEGGAEMARITKETVIEAFESMKRVGVDAWNSIEDKRARYQAGLEAMKGLVIDVRIQEIHETIRRESPGANIPTLDPGMAGGGFASGLTRVGEEGPEFVRSPPGSFVHNAAASQQMITNNQFDTIINTRATASNVMADLDFARAMAA